MTGKICPYCRQSFSPSRYHSNQEICSTSECQRQRRTDYHRKKFAEDPSYREQCRDSQRNWREKNHGYMKRYRAREDPAEERPPDRRRNLLRRLREVVKNNVALDLKSSDAEIWLVGPPRLANEKNIFASAQVIVLQGTLHAVVVNDM